jgi:hypothetical protein
MYNKAGRWTDAYKLAMEFLGSDETRETYLEKATELEQANQWKAAEEVTVQNFNCLIKVHLAVRRNRRT